MQHDDVVACLNDCHVKGSVKLRLTRRVALLVRRFHLPEDRVDHLQVGFRSQRGSSFGRKALHVPTKGYIVEHGLFMRGEQPDQRG